MHSQQLPIRLREDVLDVTSKDLAYSTLAKPGVHGNLLLGESAVDKIADKVLCFHQIIPLRPFFKAYQIMKIGFNGRMEEKFESLAARVRFARQKRGWTQAVLAARAGVQQALVSKIENGAVRATSAIARLARALGVPVRWLDEGNGQEPSWLVPAEELVELPATPDDVFDASRVVTLLASHLRGLDKPTRSAVGALLAALADDPDQGDMIATRIARLIEPIHKAP